MAEPSHPNVLLICTDHWPGSLMGCAGHPAVLTPTLDQLAANGTRFANCYSECPVCVPARRTLMTGLTPAGHGCKRNASLPMPPVTTLAQTFRNHGYQAYAVGKLHVANQRDRIGFDDVLLDEEGRAGEGVMQDDYELFLGDHGYAGRRFAGGMNNNDYVFRPWHLPEHLHVTNWAAWQMARTLKRRDRSRPGFWYLSFSHPHPPLAPLQAYLDIYRDIEPPPPHVGDWARLDEHTPTRVRARILQMTQRPAREVMMIRRAFYALCTHIDHQIRLVLGTLREEGLINDTVIMFTADHGDMLGNHNQWAKDQMNDDSNRVPMILCGAPIERRMGHHRVDDRLIGLADVMPTLLDAAGLDIPDHVEGRSMLDSESRSCIYGEWGYGEAATRMLRDRRYKLIYLPRGNDMLLFDMLSDPDELHNLAHRPEHAATVRTLSQQLIEHLDEEDRRAWVSDGHFTGLPRGDLPEPLPAYGLRGQRGAHWPPPVGGVPRR